MLANARQSERGVVLMEFAITLPLILMLMLAIIFTGLNISQRELAQVTLMRFGRMLSTNQSGILQEHVCSKNYLQELLISGKSLPPGATDSDKASAEALFLGLERSGLKPSKITSIKFFVRKLVPPGGSPAPRWYYLVVDLTANLNYALCMPGIGCINKKSLNEKAFFILESGSPLLSCLPDSSTEELEIS